MKKIKLKYFLIFLAVFAGLLIFSYIRIYGPGFINRGGDTYYFPAVYKSGWHTANRIRSKEKEGGITIYYSGSLLYDEGAARYTKTLNNIPQAFAQTKAEAGKNLTAGYYEDGKLAVILYNDENSFETHELTGVSHTTRYLAFRFYDEDEKRASDAEEICAEKYAEDIAKSIGLSAYERISRLYVVYGHDMLGTCYIRAYISSDEREFDREACNEVILYSMGGIYCDDYMRAIIYSDGCNEEHMKNIAEKTAELLNGEYREMLRTKDGYEAAAVNYEYEI